MIAMRRPTHRRLAIERLMMSYVRVGILGSTLGGEVWSVNPVFDPTGEFPGGVNQAALDAAALAIATLSPGLHPLTMISSAMSITGARVEVRDDVNDALIGISESIRPVPLAGSATPRMPAQAATVFSLRTDTPGASGRGRLYWPALGGTLSATLKLSSPAPASFLNEFKTYLTAIESALATAFPTIGFDLAVRSKATSSTPHVTRMQIGDVIDTQRRRRDNMPESYSTVTF